MIRKKSREKKYLRKNYTKFFLFLGLSFQFWIHRNVVRIQRLIKVQINNSQCCQRLLRQILVNESQFKLSKKSIALVLVQQKVNKSVDHVVT